MSVHSISTDYRTDVRGWRSWPLSGTFWGGVTVVTMWLAVLFVGIFGGNIQTAGADGSRSSWPVVAVVALSALLATVSVARAAFRAPRAEGAAQRARARAPDGRGADRTARGAARRAAAGVRVAYAPAPCAAR